MHRCTMLHFQLRLCDRTPPQKQITGKVCKRSRSRRHFLKVAKTVSAIGEARPRLRVLGQFRAGANGERFEFVKLYLTSAKKSDFH